MLIADRATLVIASRRRSNLVFGVIGDCFVATAPRNDKTTFHLYLFAIYLLIGIGTVILYVSQGGVDDEVAFVIYTQPFYPGISKPYIIRTCPGVDYELILHPARHALVNEVYKTVRVTLLLVQACSLNRNIWFNRGRLNQRKFFAPLRMTGRDGFRSVRFRVGLFISSQAKACGYIAG